MPLLQIRSDDDSCVSPSTDFWIPGGFCLDPFAAKINHSCQENIVCYFEGPELTVRARRDLAAGEELFRNYVWYLYDDDIDDVIKRKQELKRGWDIDCNCPGCIAGEVAPTGSLRQRIIAIISREDPKPVQHLKDIESIIRDMKAAGFGYDTRAMYQLHQQSLNGYNRGNDEQFLKTSLKVFTILFLSTKPPTRMFSTERSLSTMSDFIQFIHPLSYVYESAALSKDIKKCLQSCYLPWFELYVGELKNLFGRLAAIVRAATKAFDDQRKGFPQYVPMNQDSPSRRRGRRDTFLLQLNLLLAWAELPPRAKGDVFKS
jgi:SET domain